MVLTFLVSSALPVLQIELGLNFPLLLGNEQTGDRAGRDMFLNSILSHLRGGRAFSEKAFFSIGDLVADYRPTGKGSYRDQTGHLPDLSWQGQPPKFKTVQVFLTSSHWLETAKHLHEPKNS